MCAEQLECLVVEHQAREREVAVVGDSVVEARHLQHGRRAERHVRLDQRTDDRAVATRAQQRRKVVRVPQSAMVGSVARTSLGIAEQAADARALGIECRICDRRVHCACTRTRVNE